MSSSPSHALRYVAAGTFLAAILLGVSLSLLAILLWQPASSRISGGAVGRWECGLATALLVVQSVATALLFVFSEQHIDDQAASLFLFIVLCCALATRLLVKLYLVYYIHKQHFVRGLKRRIAFTVIAASVAIVGGSVSVNATYKRVILRRGGDAGVQGEGFAGSACTLFVLAATLFVFYRASSSKLVLSVIGLVVSLQSLVVATSYVEHSWIWLYRIPITNLFIVMHLLLLVAPHKRPSISTSNTQKSMPRLSTRDKQPSATGEQIEVEGLDDAFSSRWSTDTDDRRRFHNMFKGGKSTPIGSLDGHESVSFRSSEEGGGWFMGRAGPLRRPPFSSVGSDSILSDKPSPQEEAPTSPDWTTAALTPQPFQFGVDFGRYPPLPPTGRLSPSQPYSPQPYPSSPSEHLLSTSSSPPRTGRRGSLSYPPPLPTFPSPPPRAQSRRSATAPSIFPSQIGMPHRQLRGGLQEDGHAGGAGGPNSSFAVEEIGVARG